MATYDLQQFRDDPCKERSREFMKHQILERFPDAGQRRKLKVGFLTGPSLIEYDQVYAPCGILPENAYGIDADHEAFVSVSSENARRDKPIHLFYGTDMDFMDSQENLDIVSLDYTQNYGPAVVKTLHKLFDPERSLLTDQSMLLINLQAAREHSKYQWRLFALDTYSKIMVGADRDLEFDLSAPNLKKSLPDNYLVKESLDGHHTVADYLRQRKQGMDKKPGESLQIFRLGLFEEVRLLARYPILRAVGKKVLNELFESHATGVLGEEANVLSQFHKDLEYLGVKHGKDTMDVLEFASVASLMLPELYNSLGKEIKNNSAFQLTGSDTVLGYHLNRVMARVVTSYSCFSYTSSSGTAMNLQAFDLDRIFPSTLVEKIGMLAENPDSRQVAALQELFAWHVKLVGSDESKYKTYREVVKRRTDGDLSLFSCFVDARNHFNGGFRAAQDLEHILAGGRLLSYIHLLPEVAAFKFKDEISVASSVLAGEDHLDQEHKVIEDGNLTCPRCNGKHDFDEHDDEGVADAISTGEDIVVEPTNGNGSLEGKIVLSKDDKDTIREFHREGYSSKEIWTDLYEGTNIKIEQIRSICAWNEIYKQRAAQ